MERSMIGVKKGDRIRNVNIRKKTKTQDVTLKIKRLKWKWSGHMARGKDKWSKLITHWYPRKRPSIATSERRKLIGYCDQCSSASLFAQPKA
ncbi:hypothetical protein EVAR_92084_1 [Eumeta japonica]|uniref:Uncharacterized protein n=1 Tax=Eumeta variegata TaxID=151549 RepID=A0A4C1T1M9_EUMVA|nr:hypothetical protein EVAR_92084_1 [Eumeta japonica]